MCFGFSWNRKRHSCQKCTLSRDEVLSPQAKGTQLPCRGRSTSRALVTLLWGRVSSSRLQFLFFCEKFGAMALACQTVLVEELGSVKAGWSVNSYIILCTEMCWTLTPVHIILSLLDRLAEIFAWNLLGLGFRCCKAICHKDLVSKVWQGSLCAVLKLLLGLTFCLARAWKARSVALVDGLKPSEDVAFCRIGGRCYGFFRSVRHNAQLRCHGHSICGLDVLKHFWGTLGESSGARWIMVNLFNAGGCWKCCTLCWVLMVESNMYIFQNVL